MPQCSLVDEGFPKKSHPEVLVCTGHGAGQAMPVGFGRLGSNKDPQCPPIPEPRDPQEAGEVSPPSGTLWTCSRRDQCEGLEY